MPKPIKKKAVKKTTPEIGVKSLISRLKESVWKKKSVAMTVTASFIVIIAAIIVFLVYNNTTKNKAERLEYEAYKTYYGLYQKQPIAIGEQYRKAAEIFKDAYSAKKSPVSLFYIANCYYKIGQFDDAINTLKELNQKFPDDEMFVPLTYYKMAMISMRKGSSGEALKFLDILYNYKTGAYKDLSLLESGKILEAVGRTEDAKKKYEELIKSLPQSPFIEEAKARIGIGKIKS